MKMLKICILVVIALGLTACEEDNSHKERVSQYHKDEALKEKAKANCRRDMGSCSLNDTCSNGMQQIIAIGRTIPDTSKDDENCETQWNAATSRQRGAAKCEKLTSKMLYDECVRDLR